MNERPSASALEPWLRLSRAPGVGLILAHRLLDAIGGPEAIFGASDAALRAVEGIGPKTVEALRSPEAEREARLDGARLDEHEIDALTLDLPDYPAALRTLAHPPLIVYARGRMAPADRLSISIVGPRKPSDYGRVMTGRLVAPLSARGITIVSGLAYGIDAEAHTAALEAGGRTLAVLGQGLATPVFPSSNRALARRIVNQDLGALLSVFAPGTPPVPELFPRRNEIIAALSLGTLIVEAGEKSGALITATHALEFGRTVMACPGDATRPQSRGANRLIAEGAALIQQSDDILEALAPAIREVSGELRRGGWLPPEEPGAAAAPMPPRPEPAAPGDPLERSLRAALTAEHRPVDVLLEVCAAEGYGQSEVIQKLLEMELGGRVRQLPGRIYSLMR